MYFSSHCKVVFLLAFVTTSLSVTSFISRTPFFLSSHACSVSLISSVFPFLPCSFSLPLPLISQPSPLSFLLLSLACLCWFLFHIQHAASNIPSNIKHIKNIHWAYKSELEHIKTSVKSSMRTFSRAAAHIEGNKMSQAHAVQKVWFHQFLMLSAAGLQFELSPVNLCLSVWLL